MGALDPGTYEEWTGSIPLLRHGIEHFLKIDSFVKILHVCIWWTFDIYIYMCESSDSHFRFTILTGHWPNFNCCRRLLLQKRGFVRTKKGCDHLVSEIWRASWTSHHVVYFVGQKSVKIIMPSLTFYKESSLPFTIFQRRKNC